MDQYPAEKDHPRLEKPATPPIIIATAGAVALSILTADQLTKNYIIRHFSPHELVASTPFISLVYVTNTGGIFGLAQGANSILAAIGGVIAAILAFSIFYLMPPNRVYAVAFGLMLAGATGNLVDRLWHGYVIDFISLNLFHLPSFNIADASIMGGISLIGLLTLWEMREKKKGVRFSAVEEQPE